MATKTKKYRCLECNSEQDAGSYCQDCCGTGMVSIGPGIPGSGRTVKSCGMILISLGEINDRGALRVSTPGCYPEYWGAVMDWETM